MITTATEECCPRFDPEPWDGKTTTWHDKPFVTARIRALFHVPLNFGPVVKRTVQAIERAGAKPAEMIMLADACSPWHTDVLLDVDGDVPGARTTTLSGTFLTKVFEGPYRDAGRWMKEMEAYVRSRGKTLRKQYLYYTSCPKCAKKYGKNYVVVVAQVEDE
jgi:hypothetical protein